MCVCTLNVNKLRVSHRHLIIVLFIHAREKEAQTSISSGFDENSHFFILALVCPEKLKLKSFSFFIFPRTFSFFIPFFIFKTVSHFCFGFLATETGGKEEVDEEKVNFLCVIFRREGKSPFGFSSSLFSFVTNKSAENLNRSNNVLRCK